VKIVRDSEGRGPEDLRRPSGGRREERGERRASSLAVVYMKGFFVGFLSTVCKYRLRES